MVSVKAIYDGKNLKLLQDFKIDKPMRIIVTFLDEDDELITSDELNNLADNNSSFDFLKEPEEDIYEDKNLKKKYLKWEKAQLY